MAEVIIKKRYTDLAYYEIKDIPDFRVKRDELMMRFGQQMRQAATVANVPISVLQGIILIENGTLNSSLVNQSGFVGLGQINPDTASDVIIREKKKKRLSNAETEILRKQLGSRLDVLFKTDIDPKKAGNQAVDLGFSIVNQADLKNPEFNLMVSAMYISQLIDEELETTADGDLVRLDKVILRYNQGYYYKSPPAKDTTTLIAGLPVEPRNYIKKMAGKNGMMEILS